MGATSIFCTDCGAANAVQAKFCCSCGLSFDEQDITFTHIDVIGQLKPGEVLKQRYKILSQIGQGGFGAVYKAEDKELGQRQVAVKEMSQLHLSPQEVDAGIEAFKREALMLASLRHKHLPHIYDHFEEHRRWYLVMDYIEGETLEDCFKKSRDGSLPLVMALKIALQLCEVLEYLHTRQPPIVFRDLKPANVILTPEGGLYLIDFGIARHFKPGQARDTIAFGSPGYAAPEQYGKAQTTPRADIYSLGTVLHQMVSGVDPSLSPFRFAPLSRQDPALQHLIAEMLAMDEGQRPKSAAEVRQSLQYIRDHLDAPALIPARAGLVLPALSTTHHLPVLPGPRPLSTPVLVREHHYGVVHAVGWSPDSLYAASATEAIIRVWDARTGRNISSYKEHSGEIIHMAWSPTRMQIASLSEENKVRIWDAFNGKTIGLYPGNPGFNHGIARILAWSYDGRYLAVGSGRYLYIWDMDKRSVITKLRSRFSSEFNALAWAPDGKKLATAQGNNIIICQLETKPRTVYYRYGAQVNALAWSPDGAYLASGDSDRTISVWNIHTDTLLGTYAGHMQPVSALAWAPDSRKIVSGGFADVNIWDALSGRDIASYHAHAGLTLAVAWSPDGRQILSGGSDRRVCVWYAP